MSSVPNGPQDDWSSASQELFRAARSDHAPTAADRERVRRALAQRIATTPGMSVGVGVSAGGASALSRLLKVGLGISLVVVGTIAVTNAVKRAQEANPPRAEQPGIPQPNAASVPEVEPDVVTDLAALPQARLDAAPSSDLVQDSDNASQSRAARRARVRAAAFAVRPASQLSATPTAAAPAELQIAPVLQLPAQAAATNAARDTVADSRSTTPRAAQADAIAASEAERKHAHVEPLSVALAPEPQPTAAPAHSLETREDSRAADARAELALLRRIQAALRGGDSQSVLALCAEHEQRWPDGTFVQEREGLRAIASCVASEPVAPTHARAFLTKYPRTPLGPRVREACRLQLKAAKPSAAAVSGLHAK